MAVDMTALPKRRAPIAPPSLRVLTVRNCIIDVVVTFFLNSPITQLGRTS